MENKINKTCPNCNKKFLTYKSDNNDFCSRKCAYEFRRKQGYKKRLRVCKFCGNQFVKSYSSLGYYCSGICQRKSRRKPFIYHNGYKYFYLPKHPFATKQGYYPEQKYIYEQLLGRILDKKEIVHHINGIKDDNRIENLCLMVDSFHRHFHSKKLIKNQPRKNGKWMTL